ncbi:hypothetical protein T08_13531, partial [Trichinella sp. T8]
MPTFQVVIRSNIYIVDIPQRHACFKEANNRINLRYREESGGQEHSYFSSRFLMLAISRFQSQLTDFPMYRLVEIEVAALYP